MLYVEIEFEEPSDSYGDNVDPCPFFLRIGDDPSLQKALIRYTSDGPCYLIGSKG